MSIHIKYTYLLANFPLLILWMGLYLHRRDLRKPMLWMSSLIGVVSMLTGYFWWTQDWWQPATITGTRVGLEDFLIGFGSGGIMTVFYEEIFKKRLYKRKISHHVPGAITLMFLLALATFFLILVLGLTSFYASVTTMSLTACLMFYYRRDLILSGFLSGILMTLSSLVFYLPALVFTPDWVDKTYLLDNLSGAMVMGIPVEEFVFWFLAGMVWGPFYEYWRGEGLRKIAVRAN